MLKKSLIIAAAVVPVVIVSAVAQQSAIKRTPLQTVDFPPGFNVVSAIAEIAPGNCAGRHTHPGDEYGTVVEGTLVTRQDGGEWKTLEAGQSYYVPAGVVHETKNTGEKAARSYNGFIVDKGKPRATPVQ